MGWGYGVPSGKGGVFLHGGTEEVLNQLNEFNGISQSFFADITT